MLPWPLHGACTVWPELPPKELMALSDDIAANGLREPITKTSNGEVIDGRNRILAAIMAGIDPTTLPVEIYDGGPWAFSLSRNARRRHMNQDQLALAVAELVTASPGMNCFTEDRSKWTVSIAKVAAEAEVTKSKIKSALVVHKHGTDARRLPRSNPARRLALRPTRPPAPARA